MVFVISERDSAVCIFEFADWFLQFCYEKVWDLILTGRRVILKILELVVFPFSFPVDQKLLSRETSTSKKM